jgi:hypothetical protein
MIHSCDIGCPLERNRRWTGTAKATKYQRHGSLERQGKQHPCPGGGTHLQRRRRLAGGIRGEAATVAPASLY